MRQNRPHMLDPEVISRLQGLQLRARSVVEGSVSGGHRSPYRGFSIEFAEHREYSQGDDLRHVDWKVFGRTDKFYLKQYEDETNLICYIVVDASESMLYKGPGASVSKWEFAQCAAAALAWLIMQQQDSVALATFDTEVQSFVQPSSNPTHLAQVLHVLENTEPRTKKTSTGPILNELAERMNKRGVVILLSDFFDDVDAILSGLKHLAHRRHDLAVAHVLDGAELDFPFNGQTMFEGMEETPDIVTDPRSLRNAYLSVFNSYRESLERGCRAAQIDYRLARTDQPLDVSLSSWLASRMVKRR